MESFFSFLEKRVDDCSSLLCIGLDPHAADLPAKTAASALDFCRKLIKAGAPYAAAFKPNAAFFEVLGPEGWAALKSVVEAVQAESDRLGSRIPVILDAKRGDIASTADAYAQSAFQNLGVDAITLNPYLGRDSIEPFIKNRENGVFLLCKTSNPGSADIQDLPVFETGVKTSTPLYVHIARMAQGWNDFNNVGLVVGANHPQVMAEVRSAVPQMWILAPGIGSQGGELEAALKAGLRRDGKGMLINVSRSLARASNPTAAAAEMRDNIVNIKRELGY